MRKAVREIGIGAGSSALILLVVLAGSTEVVELAVLALAVGTLVWTATAEPARLLNDAGKARLFWPGVALLGAATTAGVFMQTGHFVVLGAALALAATAATWLYRSWAFGDAVEMRGVEG